MNASETLPTKPSTVRGALAEIRVCRGFLLGSVGTLDKARESEAVHSLRLALTALDDCIDALEPEPHLPTTEPGDLIYSRKETLADDRRMDRSMDRWDR